MKTEDIKTWMEMCDKASSGRSYESIYLKHGHVFSQEPLSKQDLKHVAERLSHVSSAGFLPGECYMNAGRAASSQFVFCEGMAAGYFPVPHGWVAYKGRAIDVTWPIKWGINDCKRRARTAAEIAERVEFNIANCTYWGVEVPFQLLWKHFESCGSWSPLFDGRFWRKWPEFVKALTPGNFPANIS